MRDTGFELLSTAQAFPDPYYQEFAPPRDIETFVACTWMRVVRGASGGVLQDSILPDGCADIMVYDDQPPRVAGPDATTRRVKLRDGLVIVGIRLRPGACRAVLGISAAEIVNGSLLLAELAPTAARLHATLRNTDNLLYRIAALERWVRSALKRATTRDRAVIAACRMLGANPTLDIGTVARQFDWNARTIHRQFVAACGYGPKHFQRIMRIQTAIRLAGKGAPRRLADLAAAAGYADQAHMSRDFRGITGFTPSAYLADLSPGWGAWLEGF